MNCEQRHHLIADTFERSWVSHQSSLLDKPPGQEKLPQICRIWWEVHEISTADFGTIGSDNGHELQSCRTDRNRHLWWCWRWFGWCDDAWSSRSFSFDHGCKYRRWQYITESDSQLNAFTFNSQLLTEGIHYSYQSLLSGTLDVDWYLVIW